MSDHSKTKGHHVVVLGGGIAGLSTASALRSLLPTEDRITVVEKHASHVQGLSLLWILRGWRRTEDVAVTPNENALPGVGLLRAEVRTIDIESMSVKTSRDTLHYDALIIALGAQLNTKLIPGLAGALQSGAAGEFCTPSGAESAHHRLQNLRSGRVALVVSSLPYKCPGAPWEAAFLSDDLLREVGVRENIDLHIYTPEPQPMPVAGPVVGAALVEMLDSRNIGHHFNEPLASIDQTVGQLTFTSGTRADFDYTLVVPPHQPPKPVREARFSEPGWIPVDAHHLTTKVSGVWALGDNSSITLTNGKPLPKAAVFARGEADVVANGVARYLGRQAPDTIFDGMGHCYLEMGGHLAAKGAGNFYATGGPDIKLQPSSAENHEEKQREEEAWLKEWNQLEVSANT